MPTENYGINDYLDKVMEYGKEASDINHPIRREKRKGRKINELLKKPGLWKIVEEFNQVYMKAQNIDLNAFKKEIEEAFKKS